jgi:hypothetical protein
MFTPDYDAILKAYDKYVIDNQERHKTIALKDRVDTRYLPCQEYHAYDFWQPPETIETLFLAESPPWSGKENYFYNRDYEPDEGRSNLSTILFNKLHIELETKCDKLTEFKRRNCFLSDSVKCVFRKTLPHSSEANEGKKRIPGDLRRLSVDIVLKDELSTMKPQTIFLLGSTALKALSQLEKFRLSLRNVRVTRDCGQRIHVGNTNVIVCVFLNAQNLQLYRRRIDQAFAELAGLQ